MLSASNAVPVCSRTTVTLANAPTLTTVLAAAASPPLPTTRTTIASSVDVSGATSSSVTPAAEPYASALIRSNGVSTASASSTCLTATPAGSSPCSTAGATPVSRDEVTRSPSRLSGVKRHSSSSPLRAGKSATSNDRSSCDLVLGGGVFVSVVMV